MSKLTKAEADAALNGWAGGYTFGSVDSGIREMLKALTEDTPPEVATLKAQLAEAQAREAAAQKRFESMSRLADERGIKIEEMKERTVEVEADLEDRPDVMAALVNTQDAEIAALKELSEARAEMITYMRPKQNDFLSAKYAACCRRLEVAQAALAAGKGEAVNKFPTVLSWNEQNAQRRHVITDGPCLCVPCSAQIADLERQLAEARAKITALTNEVKFYQHGLREEGAKTVVLKAEVAALGKQLAEALEGHIVANRVIVERTERAEKAEAELAAAVESSSTTGELLANAMRGPETCPEYNADEPHPGWPRSAAKALTRLLAEVAALRAALPPVGRLRMVAKWIAQQLPSPTIDSELLNDLNAWAEKLAALDTKEKGGCCHENNAPD